MYSIKYIIKHNHSLLQNFFAHSNMNIGCICKTLTGSGSIKYIAIFSCL